MAFADVITVEHAPVDGLIKNYMIDTGRSNNAFLVVDNPNAKTYLVIGGKVHSGDSLYASGLIQVLLPDKSEQLGIENGVLYRPSGGQIPTQEVNVDMKTGFGKISVTLRGEEAIKYLLEMDIGVIRDGFIPQTESDLKEILQTETP